MSTPKEFLYDLVHDVVPGDPEMEHRIHDEKVMELLVVLGYGDAVRFIQSRTRWFA